MFWKKRIYLDNASATLIDPKVVRAVSEALHAFQGNPSAPHEEGRKAREAISASREKIARSFSVKPEELIFTSGGTEANNIAIRGLIEGLRERGAAYADLHIVTTSIEHSSVLKTVDALKKEGVEVTYIDPESDGIVKAETVVRAVKKNTALITLAHVNSELGTIQPISDIASLLSKTAVGDLSRLAPECRFPVIHADAAQSPLYLDASPHLLKASLVSFDAQKARGPKGIGLLYRDFSVPLAPLYGGGTQERSLRPGTENVAGIVGAGVAFDLAKEGRKERAEKVSALRDSLIAQIEKEIPGAHHMGSRKHRIANNAHFVISGVSGDYLAVLMDKEGIAVSPRSACIGSGEALSHVVYAITKDEKKATETIRFSLGVETQNSDIGRAVTALKKCISIASGK